MNLENWMECRDIAEHIISQPELFLVVDIAWHLERREEAEQEIERILRA